MNEIELAQWVDDVIKDTGGDDTIPVMLTWEQMSAHEAALAQAELRRRTGRPYTVVAARMTTLVTVEL